MVDALLPLSHCLLVCYPGLIPPMFVNVWNVWMQGYIIATCLFLYAPLICTSRESSDYVTVVSAIQPPLVDLSKFFCWHNITVVFGCPLAAVDIISSAHGKPMSCKFIIVRSQPSFIVLLRGRWTGMAWIAPTNHWLSENLCMTQMANQRGNHPN